jgi:hypothetical protein
MPKNRARFGIVLAALSLTVSVVTMGSVPRSAKDQHETKSNQNIVREVRHQLLLLPYYSVFDNLAFKVDGDRVTLEGQVTRPTLKSDAEAAVKSIESIAGVTNNIEVLPPSPMDDQLRHALYRASMAIRCSPNTDGLPCPRFTSSSKMGMSVWRASSIAKQTKISRACVPIACRTFLR